MKKEWLVKSLALGVVVLFIGMSTIPVIGSLSVEKHILTKELIYKSEYRNDNDTTPPVTTHNLDPPEPNGLNDWYVSDVTVTLNATDDLSGVKEIRYRINGGAVQVIPGDNGSFIIDKDGMDILIVYWAIDYNGNEEMPHNWFTVDIDQTPPDTCLIYEIVGGNWWRGWDYEFSLMGTDKMSNVNITYYRINSGEWVIYTEPFILSRDGDEILIEYYSVDYAGNVEDVKSTTIPRTRATSNPWYHWFLERFPLLEKLIKILSFFSY